MGGFASGASGADREALLGTVDTGADEKQRSGGKALLLQRANQSPHQIGHHAFDGFGGGNRLQQAKKGLGRIGGYDRFERFRDPAQRLVQASQQNLAETADERRGGHRHDVAHPFDAEAAGGDEYLFIDP